MGALVETITLASVSGLAVGYVLGARTAVAAAHRVRRAAHLSRIELAGRRRPVRQRVSRHRTAVEAR